MLLETIGFHLIFMAEKCLLPASQIVFHERMEKNRIMLSKSIQITCGRLNNTPFLNFPD